MFKHQQDEIQKAKDQAETVELEKRANAELAEMPGETAAKVKLLKGLKGLGAEERKTLDTMLKAGNAAVKAGFAKIGHRGGNGEGKGDPAEFEKRVSEIAKRDKCSNTTAMQKAREEFPDAFQAYQDSAPPASAN